MFIFTLYNIRLSTFIYFIYLYAPTDMLTIETDLQIACLHSEIVGIPSFT